MNYEPLYDPTGGQDARIYAHQCAHERQEHHLQEEVRTPKPTTKETSNEDDQMDPANAP